MSDLPKDYDVIIAGTGLTESILAAALARIGKTVLHIDRNRFYGGEFSCHSLASLIEWIDILLSKNDSESKINSAKEEILDETFKQFECNNDLKKYFFDIETEWTRSTVESGEKIEKKLLDLSRRFSIDLSPNIFYSRGKFIELLISSDVSKYCEFRMVTQILTRRENQSLEKVPTSRSEVFKTNKLTMIEKRMMMQFIQACLKDNNFKDLIDENEIEKISFRKFIENRKLPALISKYLINAVAMCPNEDQTAKEGLNEVKRFLSSVGRFGDSPFLYSLYGVGELPQCFCRMAAVFGAIYHLNLTIDSFTVNKESNLIESVKGNTEANNLNFNCKNLIIDSSYAPLEFFVNETSKQISRCVLITDKSLFTNEINKPDENISLLFFPKTSETASDIYCIEVSSASQCVSNGYYLVYLFCVKTILSKTSKQIFEEFREMFFEKPVSQTETNENQLNHEQVDISLNKIEPDSNASDSNEKNFQKPKILFSYYFSHYDTNYRLANCIKKEINIPNNLSIIGGSLARLDYDFHIEQAQEIFKKICPGEEFLPRPPDQEDIIFDVPSTSESNENSSAKEESTTEVIEKNTDHQNKE